MNSSFQLALACQRSGDLDQAEQLCRQEIDEHPQDTEAWNLLGVIALSTGRSSLAVHCLGQAVRLAPENVAFQFNLGSAQSAAGQWDEAIASFEHVLKLDSDWPGATNNLRNLLVRQSRFVEAIERYSEAIRLRPNNAALRSDLGTLFAMSHQLAEAEESFREAVRLEPQSAIFHYNLGNVLTELGRVAEAVTRHEVALALEPGDPAAEDNRLLAMNYDPTIDPDLLFAEHVRWGEQQARLTVPMPPSVFQRPHSPLRVGFLSPDFRRHPVASFVEPLLRNLDPDRVTSVCYAEVGCPDDVTERLRSLAGAWRSTCGTSDEELARQVRADEIDLLIDLAGHTSRNRLRVLAHRPALSRASWLGYPNTSGLPGVDYRLTDAVLDPPGEPPRATEELLRLPHGFCCYQSPADAPEVQPLPALTRGFITFGSLHGLLKLNPAVIDLWCRVLDAVPDSRLLMYRDVFRGAVRDRLLQEFTQRGILADRIDVRHVAPTGGGYFAVYHEIDISLDPFPWSGHTTACESLWMCVPTVTLRGNRTAGRLVASVLTSAGMPEWIAETPDEYVAMAVQAANRIESLATLRAGLRPQIATSALCDGARFARDFQDAIGRF